MRRVFLGGEGASELGGWARERVYRTEDPGILETLARCVQADGWSIVDAVCWKNIRKYQAGRSKHNDIDNVLGLVLTADEAGCDVVVFSRDDDGDDETAAAVGEGIRRAAELFDVDIVGGPCRPCIEGWVLAACGQARTESLRSRHAKALAAERFGEGREALVDAVAGAELGEGPAFARVAGDAETLRAWLHAAVRVLAAER